MVQFLPMPAIAFPQNAMLNFQPMNQALQFYAQNQLDRGRFGLQQNADVREQEMHPLRMDQTRAQTGLVGAQTTSALDANRRANTREPYELRHLTAQTGLTNAQTGQVGVQTALGRVNLANANDDRDQRIATLFAMAPTPEAHAALVQSLQGRGVRIPPALLNFQNVRGVAPTLGGAQYTQAQTAQAQLNRLDPIRDADTRRQMAAQLGIQPGTQAYNQYVLLGTLPQGQPLDSTSRRELFESDEAVNAGSSAISALNEALQLSGQAYAGWTAGARGAVAGNLGGAAGQATMRFNQLMQSQALEQLKAIFGAAPTEGERKILMDIQGAASQPQAVRDAIIRRAIIAAQSRIQFHQQRAAALRGGTYFQPGYNPSAGAPAGVSVQQLGPQGVQTTTADQINATPVGQVVTINGRRFRRMPDGGFNPE